MVSEMSEDDKPRYSGRNADGRFAVGNPGKIPGTRHKATIAAQTILDGEAEKLTRKAVEKAMEGDPVALRLCLERIVPPTKDRPISFDMPRIETSKDCSTAMVSLLLSVASGEVTPEVGATVATLIEKHARIREVSDFEARLKALEEKLNGKDH
jgi:hypothetical protein